MSIKKVKTILQEQLEDDIFYMYESLKDIYIKGKDRNNGFKEWIIYGN